jgi:Cu(I)/Ag(I) efflux system membrane fusion protein
MSPSMQRTGGQECPRDVSDRSLRSQISEEREQLIGVKTSPVVRREISKLVRASGRIAYDPDLYSALVEYREALKSRNKAKTARGPMCGREPRGSFLLPRVCGCNRWGCRILRLIGWGEAKGDPTNLLLGQKGGTVWVYAQIYEYEIGLVKTGQKMEISSVAFPGRTFYGTGGGGGHDFES